MTKTIHGARQRRQCGFTLIELLVVVIILGIISAVVVFAVRGSGDKGLQAAIDTDERIIRTAMESFCARRGHYPGPGDEGGPNPMNVLVEQKFLSSPSEYHGLSTGPKGPAYPEGICDGKGYRLTGGGGDDEPPTRCRLGDGTDVLAEAGRWCMAAAPIGPVLRGRSQNLVQLEGTPALCGANCGRVLVLLEPVHDLPPTIVNGETTTSGYPTALFDPVAGPEGAEAEGAWIEGPPVAAIAPTESDFVPMVLLRGSAAECGERCGMVLAHFPGRRWKLYDPSNGATGSWTDVEAPASGDPGTVPVQLLGEGCAPHCGKVLITGYAHQDPPKGVHVPSSELYDPGANEFSDVGPWDLPNRNHYNSTLVELPDGRVLMVSTFASPCCSAKARLLNLEGSVLGFQEIDPPISNSTENWPTVLPDSLGVLFVPRPVVQIYHPNSGAGSWETVPNCIENTTQKCQPIAQLPGGDVLVHRANTNDDLSLVTRIFRPTAPAPWSDTRWTMNTQGAAGPAVMLSAAPCAPNCGRVLMVRSEKAELYTP